MVTGERYRLLSDRNRLREVEVRAHAGVIYDRNGEILARNRPSFSVVVIPADLPKDAQEIPTANSKRSSWIAWRRSWHMLSRSHPTPTRRPAHARGRSAAPTTRSL